MVFYMDILSPKDATSTSTSTSTSNTMVAGDIIIDASTSIITTNQQKVIQETQSAILQEVSLEYQIDPILSKGIRCFDLPVDGSTWLVQMSIDTNDFVEVTLFGGCRELEWDEATQDCRFYEARLKGFYVGAIPMDQDGVEFTDVVNVLETLIDGPTIVDKLSSTDTNTGNGTDTGNDTNNDNNNDNDPNHYYRTAFLGVPRTDADPNFQAGGSEEGRDVLKQPVNIKTGIDASQSTKGNRKTITVVGGLLVACFSIAFFLVGYIVFQRRRSYRRDYNNSNNNNNGVAAASGGDERIGNPTLAVDSADGDYDLDEDDETNHDDEYGDNDDEYGDNDNHRRIDHGEGRDSDPESFRDDDDDDNDDVNQQQRRRSSPENQRQRQRQTQEEYPDLPMSAEAIQMDLGNTLKSQLMGLHGSTSRLLPSCGPLGGSSNARGNGNSLNSGLYAHHQLHDDGDNESNDDVDSWAQTDGTIGSLELQLEPITAEV